MRDEEYEFFSDCREKKSIANSAFKQRTHCGKGGRVRLPSDNLTKKELEKMSGECKSYRLNAPMKFEEFVQMPDDLKKMYLTILIKKYNVSGQNIAAMMGCADQSILNYAKKLGIVFPRRNRYTVWDKEGWYAWISGTPKPAEEVTEAEAEEILEILGEEEVPFTQKPIGQIVEEALAKAEEVEEIEAKAKEFLEETPEEEDDEDTAGRFDWHTVKIYRPVIPMTGNMVFEGEADQILESIRQVLGSAKVQLSVTWDVVED